MSNNNGPSSGIVAASRSNGSVRQWLEIQEAQKRQLITEPPMTNARWQQLAAQHAREVEARGEKRRAEQQAAREQREREAKRRATRARQLEARLNTDRIRDILKGLPVEVSEAIRNRVVAEGKQDFPEAYGTLRAAYELQLADEKKQEKK